MPWEPGTLLGLRDTTVPFGKYPGASLFVLLGTSAVSPLTAVVITPHGTRAAIPWQYLVPVQHGVPEARQAHPTRG